MADSVITSAFFQTFQDVAGAFAASINITDSFGSRNVGPGTAGTFWRIWAAQSAWTGASRSNPKELLAAIAAAANAGPGSAYWGLTLRPTGAVRVTYNGGTGAATWLWNSAALRNVLGFSGNLSFSAPGQFAEGTVNAQPLFCAFSHNARRNSQGMVPVPRRMAVGQTDGGGQYAWVASKAGATWAADLATHPYDSAAKTALNATSVVVPGTILWPDDTARWQTPVSVPGNSLNGPWSLVDFFNTVPGTIVGAYFGNFQDSLSSTAQRFMDVRIERDTLMARGAVVKSRPQFSRLIDWRNVQYTLNAVRDRT